MAECGFPMCIALSIIPFVNTVTYLERKHQFLHELADGYYSPGPYLLAEGVTIMFCFDGYLHGSQCRWRRSVPPALRFLVFLSPYFYLFEGLAIALYEDNEEIFSDAEHASRFGYMSSNEMFSYFGLAGTFTKTKLSPKEWFWVADVLPLAACTLGVHAVCWLYWINKRLYK
ncbi:ATP-binding cassette, sub-family G, member 1, related [Eimeria acervulina]|uniref:ATP-binding cassette, sub-family G, member 1, related n=1 Tax=Eimeria acervulina TaxID=5801 RepID=U6GPL9_EIMAC|nr:ATP-binding cassette, sub-family G, member 1, related [Eimeria acervulina]CDI82166.1 ATP-binding cassette, sub-family G, member 1, related [Eimeria acervulina]